MTASMTGYAANDFTSSQGILLLELKSVNSRYLDLQFKLDEFCKPFEFLIRDVIKSQLHRGKVECKLQLIPLEELAHTTTINQQALERLKALSMEVLATMPEAKPLSVQEILQWPEVLKKDARNASEVEGDVKRLVTQALSQLVLVRQQEGEKLNQIIREKLTAMEAIVERVRPKMQQVIETYQAKLTMKLKEAIQSFDDDRINQEMVLFAQRADVDEELSRLTVHIESVKKLLTKSGPVGKRLDFMMQEMNRESNTLGSKSLSIDTTKAAMDLKVLIEQMREQIQNIE